MKIPALRGIIRRRILLNYRLEPEVVAALLPKPFRPKLVAGKAIAGICLIRLEQIRPRSFPAFLGIASENSAHRFAVEWGTGSEKREGVFVPRRDTGSLMNSLAGGRIFPGVHHHSKFAIEDRDGRITLHAEAADQTDDLVHLELSESREFPADSVFDSLADSSAFFEAGCVGYSSRPDSPRLDGLLLQVPNWKVSPLKIHEARSAYFDDRALFPEGCIELDHALLMRDTEHEWHAEPELAS